MLKKSHFYSIKIKKGLFNRIMKNKKMIIDRNNKNKNNKNKSNININININNLNITNNVNDNHLNNLNI
jgi:hypothetical protein